jgi:hypothetical protein
MIPLRRSAVEAAGQCLFRYNKLYNEGVPEQNDPALRGIAFHACAHRYILRLVDKRLVNDAEEAREAFAEGIAAIADFPARLVVEVRTLFDRWAEKFDLDVDAYLTSEEHAERSEQTFTPDLVYLRPTGLQIVDFKTYWVGLTEAQARADWQTRWYIRNAMIEWPNCGSYTFTYSFVRLNSSLSVTFQPHELDDLQREIEAVQGRILESHRTGMWAATPGPACSYCNLKCPAVDNLPIVPKRLDGPLALQVAEKLLAAEQLIKLAKKALKGYCAENGPVTVNGIEWANRPTVSRSIPVDAILDAFKKLKIDRQAAEVLAAGGDLTISASALGKIQRLYPELENLLAPHVREKTGYRFSARKPGDDEEEE